MDIEANIILGEYTSWGLLPARELLLKAPSMTESLQSIVSAPRDHLHASVHPKPNVNVKLPFPSFLSSIAKMGRVTVRSAPVTSTESERQFGYGEGKRDTPPLDRPSSDEFGTRSTASTPERTR